MEGRRLVVFIAQPFNAVLVEVQKIMLVKVFGVLQGSIHDKQVETLLKRGLGREQAPHPAGFSL